MKFTIVEPEKNKDLSNSTFGELKEGDLFVYGVGMLLDIDCSPIIYIKINNELNSCNALAIGRSNSRTDTEKEIFKKDMRVRKIRTELIVYKD